MKTEMTEQEILGYLDGHIRSWRENFKLSDPGLRARGVSAVDALQQFRLVVFGSLLPQDDGTYGVSVDGGESMRAFSTEAQALQAYNDANKEHNE